MRIESTSLSFPLLTCHSLTPRYICKIYVVALSELCVTKREKWSHLIHRNLSLVIIQTLAYPFPVTHSDSHITMHSVTLSPVSRIPSVSNRHSAFEHKQRYYKFCWTFLPSLWVIGWRRLCSILVF